MGVRYWSMLAAYLVAAAGDEFYVLALPLVLLGLGYPGSSATFLRCGLMATTVVSGFLVGSLVDRCATGPLLTASYLASSGVLVGASISIFAGVDGYLVSLLAACMLGVFVALAAAAVDAGVPRAVPQPDRVRRGYSLVESARVLASILGPAAAGPVAGGRSLTAIAGVNAASFAAAAGITRIGGRTSREAAALRLPVVTRDRSYWAQTVTGLHTVAQDPRLRLGVGLSVLTNVTLGADEILFLVRAVRELHMSTVIASTVVVIAGMTSIAASLLLVRRAHPVPSPVAMICSAFILGSAATGIGVTGHAAVGAVLFCLLMAASTCYTVYWRSYRQEIVPPDQLGRVSAVCRSLAYAGVVAGTGVVGLLQTAGVGTGPLLVSGGTSCAAGVVVIAFALRVVDQRTVRAR